MMIALEVVQDLIILAQMSCTEVLTNMKLQSCFIFLHSASFKKMFIVPEIEKKTNKQKKSNGIIQQLK